MRYSLIVVCAHVHVSKKDVTVYRERVWDGRAEIVSLSNVTNHIFLLLKVGNFVWLNFWVLTMILLN